MTTFFFEPLFLSFVATYFALKDKTISIFPSAEANLQFISFSNAFLFMILTRFSSEVHLFYFLLTTCCAEPIENLVHFKNQENYKIYWKADPL